jgi:hypothetical protein
LYKHNVLAVAFKHVNAFSVIEYYISLPNKSWKEVQVFNPAIKVVGLKIHP